MPLFRASNNSVAHIINPTECMLILPNLVLNVDSIDYQNNLHLA